ncbi:hypothetical protein MFLO_01470 [Listeria floridensis FSL S10-1187]|uniref:Uncharacterized protein n=1 Tax=Listeria floridensis FSL S10-1187 TaxID=1265817 RepID=A0ABP3B1Y0_9LIST|nr:hypothetical protein MFLO_01470 [Listeria floridensis FSL S10-1187]
MDENLDGKKYETGNSQREPIFAESGLVGTFWKCLPEFSWEIIREYHETAQVVKTSMRWDFF